VAAKSLHVRLARSRREVDNAYLVLVPDPSRDDEQIVELKQKRGALEKLIDDHRQKLDALRRDKDVASYLLLAGKLRRHEATLSAEQQVGWRRLFRLAPSVGGGRAGPADARATR